MPDALPDQPTHDAPRDHVRDRATGMRAVANSTDGGPRRLQLREVPVPHRAPGHVLVEVRAAGVAFPDVLQSRSEYQHRIPTPFVLGSEFAGVIAEAGEDSGFAPGDRVFGVASHGAFAEYVVAPADRVLPLPDSISFVDAAALPINLLSADFAIRDRGQVRAGETVLIQGAAGGLGVALIQQAKLIGATVIAVVSTEEKAALARSVGADHTVFAADFLAEVRQLTDHRGVDVVLDPVGGDRFTDSLRCLAKRGRLVVLGFTGGSIPTVKTNRLLLGNISVVGAAWEGLMPECLVSLPEQWARLSPAVERGELRASITAVVPLREAAEAVASLEERRARGKVVINLGLE
ncbi:NADPH:quinone oxidoreductase family protein [Pseudoclavibacter sp. VKM Ac-2867]|uniref:NADPH:quinone oxidoreductase family protein n=1 Tax=Pseudoclavibacter sp. VKM Ac-2867 TaxID=2783829 RepID=UPI001E346873|nr:NADPH:quinone oxidoreductase family protein [Pseudoclavibacter sp. VKM Ac-2867]